MKDRAITLIALGALSFPVWLGVVYQGTRTEVSGVQVINKERVSSKDSSKYLIWVEGETFKNTDDLLNWKWNSSDVYGEIRVGAVCNFEVVGWRIPWLSMYRDILTAECQ